MKVLFVCHLMHHVIIGDIFYVIHNLYYILYEIVKEMKHAFMSHARKMSHCKDKICGEKFSVELQLTVLWFKDYVS